MLHPPDDRAALLRLEPEPERCRDSRSLRVLLAAPRGFCAGVRRAIDAVIDALETHGPPVYVRRPIVHNLEVVRELQAQGAVFIEELDQAPAGSVVIFSAHGVSPTVKRAAQERGLVAYDAVCPLVAKVHREVERHDRDGRQLVLIGHDGHAEIEGTIGHVPGGASIVSNAADVHALPLQRDKPTAYAVQTTYSVEEAAEVVTALKSRFPDLRGPASSDICYATTNRQAAARDIARQVDTMIVVGERFSSNANRLVEVAHAVCGSAQLVAGADDVDWSLLDEAEVVGITAAASTPESSVLSVIRALEDRFTLDIEELESVREATVFKRLAIS